MKKNFFVVLLLVVCISGCSSIESVSEQMNVSEEVGGKESEPPITYEEAFDYVSGAEDVIVDNNKDVYNELKESAAEKIVFSDEYAALYCSYWKALEELAGENDSRYGKSKMRWQVDYSNEEWTNLLKEALVTGGIGAFQDEYYRIYDEEVFPEVKYRWENSIN